MRLVIFATGQPMAGAEGWDVNSLRVGTFEFGASLLGMDSDMHATDAHGSKETNISRTEPDNSLWTFFPILLSAAALCFLMFLFLSPSFEAGEPVRARSARPGAETSVTERQRDLTERHKDKSVQSP
jgi:hypothetical protein